MGELPTPPQLPQSCPSPLLLHAVAADAARTDPPAPHVELPSGCGPHDPVERPRDDEGGEQQDEQQKVEQQQEQQGGVQVEQQAGEGGEHRAARGRAAG